MQVPSSTKTEQRAVNALETIIDEHSTMIHQFNGNDKEMSWDGYIWLYKKNDGAQSKSNFDGRVSVQIKGHNDPQHKFLNDCACLFSKRNTDITSNIAKYSIEFHFLQGRKGQQSIAVKSFYDNYCSYCTMQN